MACTSYREACTLLDRLLLGLPLDLEGVNFGRAIAGKGKKGEKVNEQGRYRCEHRQVSREQLLVSQTRDAFDLL
jgi:hypothetical protein